MEYLLMAAAAYLIGSFCASIPLSKHFYGADVRTQGSGNAGATNVARVFGLKAGLITLAFDMAKTIIAMLIGSAICGEAGKALAGACCIIGHCFPVYFGFRGGKGVSVGAALGVMSGWGVFAAIMAAFFVAAFTSRKVSIGSCFAAIALPAAAAMLDVSTPMLIMNIFAALLVVLMHRSNIKRILNGTEPDFRAKKL